MASVTAFVIIGTPHPNESSIHPDTIVELWEGSRATWVVRRVENGSVIRRVHPKEPAAIGRSLLETLQSMTHQSDLHGNKVVDMSIVVAPLPGSSVLAHLDLLRGITACDVHILDSIFSRTFSSWTGQWNLSGNSVASVGQED